MSTPACWKIVFTEVPCEGRFTEHCAELVVVSTAEKAANDKLHRDYRKPIYCRWCKVWWDNECCAACHFPRYQHTTKRHPFTRVLPSAASKTTQP
jgi:hypothetical protein